tara:strand:+ start:6245 stop:6928 length:684 start_codon:yes stop_codon:yes gene_type:complete
LNIKEKIIGELKTIVVEPDIIVENNDTNLIIVLHGYGANMNDLVSLSENIGDGKSIFVFPNAPFEFQLSYQLYGYAWIFPPTMDSEEMPESMTESIDKLMVAVDILIEDYNIKLPNVILGGFSQGAMMSASFGLIRPDIFKGIFMLSGMLLGESYLVSNIQSDNGQRVFVSHGEFDSLVPFSNLNKIVKFLENYGYSPEFHQYPMGHELSPQSINDLGKWINSFNDD